MSETSVDQQEEAAGEGLSDDEASGVLDPEERARRAYALAQVRQYPDTALRMKAREVEQFDEPLAALAERMTTLMGDARGVGLAAPQVGVLQRLVVYQAAEESGPVALVNPTLVGTSDETEVGEEGCLSLGRASVNVDVERALEVTIEAMSPAGEQLAIEASRARSPRHPARARSSRRHPDHRPCLARAAPRGDGRAAAAPGRP